ncbi:MAG: MMPL family transporter [Candidatus Methanomethylophilaceae archaeon]
MFDKLADTIMKHPKRIVLLWVIILLASIPFAAEVMLNPTNVLSYDMTEMSGENSESVQGFNIINDPDLFYSSNVDMSTILVIECDSDEQLAAISAFDSDLDAALKDHYGTDAEGNEKVSTVPLGFYSKTDTYPGIVLVDISFLDNMDPSDEITQIRSIISDVKSTDGYDLTTYLTGSAAIGYDTENGAMTDVEKIDPVSILLVLVLIGLFFRSVISAATPPITIGFAYGIVLAVIFALAQVMDIYYITSTIVMVSMLGAGCDYCIFIIARYREERKGGKDHDRALRESIKWAGESITISGCSVIIGFGVMSFCSFSMVSTMGMVLASGIVFALLAALTLIPSILAIVGDRIFYPSNMDTYTEGSKAMRGWYGKASRFGARYFSKSAKFSIKYALPIVVVALLVTVPLTYVALTEESSYDMISIMPNGEAKDGVNAIVEYADGGLLMPTYVVLDIDTSESGSIANIDENAITIPGYGTLGVLVWNDYTRTLVYLGQTNELATQIENEGTGNVDSVTGIYSWDYILEQCGGDVQIALSLVPELLRDPIGQILSVPDDTWSAVAGTYTKTNAIDYIIDYGTGSLSKDVGGNQYIKMTVLMLDEPMSNLSMDAIANIERITDDFMTENQYFEKSWVTGSVVVMYEVSEIVNSEFNYIELAVILLILLLLFFVMRSYLTPLRAVLTILMSIGWTLGMTHILFSHLMGVPVTWIVPIILFVICLGLGMDYDILLTTRIKENVSKGMTNDEAITHAVERSGAVITICGLIMSGAFGTMMLSSSPMLMEFGFALGFAIFIDALVVRTYIVPAVMHLLGRWNWVGPEWLKTENRQDGSDRE